MVVTIAALDTIVAIAAGLAIFPVVFAYGSELTVEAGPSLMFETVPLVFGNIPFGSIFGTLFFCASEFCSNNIGNFIDGAWTRILGRGVQCQTL